MEILRGADGSNIVDQGGKDEAELAYRSHELHDLPLGMLARIIGVRFQLFGRPILKLAEPMVNVDQCDDGFVEALAG